MVHYHHLLTLVQSFELKFQMWVVPAAAADHGTAGMPGQHSLLCGRTIRVQDHQRQYVCGGKVGDEGE